MKKNFLKYLANNGIYMVLVLIVLALLGVSAVAGFNSGKKEKNVAENAAEFKEGKASDNETEEPNEAVSGRINLNDKEDAAANDDSDLDYTEGYNADEIQDIISGQLSENETQETEAVQETEGVAVNSEVTIESFDESQKMTWPLSGDVILNYSMDKTVYFKTLDQYKCNPGILIKGEVNSPVVAAADGTVETVGTDSELGTIVIVDMGNSYKAVYGQLKDVNVGPGDKITAGQDIGVVAQPTKYFGDEGSHLNFKVTHADEPVNPMDFLE